MKNAAFILTLALLASSAYSDGGSHKWTLTEAEKEQIAWAIKLLAYSDAMKTDANQCVQFDQDLINELKKSGLLKNGDSKLMTFCVGSSLNRNKNKEMDK